MPRFVVSLLLLLLAVGGCSLVTGPDPVSTEWGFSARASSGRLILSNASQARVHYVAVAEGQAALIDLNPDYTAWPAVEPGGEERISYSRIMGYQRGAKRVIVHWTTGEEWGILKVELD